METQGEDLVKGIPRWNFERQRSRTTAWLRQGGIDMKEIEDKRVLVRQFQVHNGHIRTNKELHQIGRFWWPEKEYKIVPQTYSLQLDEITPEWITEQAKELGIKPKDIMHQTGITLSEISVFFSGKRPMTRAVRALFYYYFLTFRLNRDLRKPPISSEELAEAIQLVQERKAKEQGEAQEEEPQD